MLRSSISSVKYTIFLLVNLTRLNQLLYIFFFKKTKNNSFFFAAFCFLPLPPTHQPPTPNIAPATTTHTIAKHRQTSPVVPPLLFHHGLFLTIFVFLSLPPFKTLFFSNQKTDAKYDKLDTLRKKCCSVALL
jgi:hypothetical protein